MSVPTKRLAELCEIKPPKSEARKRLGPDAPVSFAPMEDLSVDQKYLAPRSTRRLDEVAGSYTYFSDGDVLLAKITPCFENGKLGIAQGLENGVGFGSSEFVVLRPSAELDAEFLYYFLAQATIREHGAAAMTGAVGHKRIPKEFVAELRIPELPLTEQQRIVAILDEAFAGIATARAAAEQNRQNARALFEGCLREVFNHAWQTGTVGTLSDLATDITDGDHMPPPKSESGIPFITIGNIRKDTRQVDFSDTFKVPFEYFNGLKENKKPKLGDILYTVTGSFGIPVLITEVRDFCFQRHIGLVRPKDGFSSEWVYYLLMSPQIFKQADEGATGTAQKTVSLKLLRGFQMPVIPYQQQLADVARLNALEAETQHLESLYQRKLAALDELKQSILHQAFSGAL